MRFASFEGRRSAKAPCDGRRRLICIELRSRRHNLLSGEVVRTVKAGTRGATRVGCLTTQGRARPVPG